MRKQVISVMSEIAWIVMVVSVAYAILMLAQIVGVLHGV